MKRILLFLTCFLTLFAIAKAQSDNLILVQECKFGANYNSAKVSSYTNDWTCTNNGFTWNIVNANNSNNTWEYIRCGSSSKALTASITTSTPIPEAICEITLTIDAITANSINSIKLYSGADSDNCNTPLGEFNKTQGPQSITLSDPQPNLCYKIEIDCATAKSNGPIQISSVGYYKEPDANKQSVTLSFPEDKYLVPFNQNFNSPTLSVDPVEATEYVKYSSSDPNVASINESTGEITIKSVGATTITANIPEDDTFNESSTSYILVVFNPETTETDITPSFFNYTGNSYTAKTAYDDLGFMYSGVFLSSTDSNHKGYFQFNSTTNKGCGIAISSINEDYIITSVDIYMQSEENGVNVYKSSTAFPILAMTSEPDLSQAILVQSVTTKTTVAINDYAFAIFPTGSKATYIEKIIVHYQLAGVYLTGTFIEGNTNPSYRFTETEEGSGIYTLTVGSITQGYEFAINYDGLNYTLKSENSIDPSSIGSTLATAQPLSLSQKDGTASFDNSYINVTFQVDFGGQTPILYIYGTLASENDWNVSVGNDKTMQSGEIIDKTLNITVMENAKGGVLYVYPPQAADVLKKVYFQTSKDDSFTGSYTPAFYDEENGCYKIGLDVTGNTSHYLSLYYLDSNDEKYYSPVYSYTVKFGTPTAVEAIGAEEGEAEYYTLQGVKVQNPDKGIYIKVANGKAVKVIR